MKCLGSRLFVPWWLPMLALALLSACGGGSSDDSDAPPLSQAHSTTLGEVRQTPSNNSNGRNIGILTVNAHNNSFTARLITSGTNGTNGTITQIQEGQTDAAGAVIVKFIKDPGSGEWKASGTYTQEPNTALEAGK